MRNRRRNTEKTEIEENRVEEKKTQRRRRKANHRPSRSPASNRQQHSLEATTGPPLFLLLLLRCTISTVLREQWRVLHCSLDQTSLAQPKISGPSPARSKKYSKKNIFLKICDSSAYSSTNFCLILVCIFTS